MGQIMKIGYAVRKDMRAMGRRIPGRKKAECNLKVFF